MMKKVRIPNLQNGDVVICANNNIYMLVNDYFVGQDGGFNEASCYQDKYGNYYNIPDYKRSNMVREKFRIVKVYRNKVLHFDMALHNNNLIYEENILKSILENYDIIELRNGEKYVCNFPNLVSFDSSNKKINEIDVNDLKAIYRKNENLLSSVSIL